MADFTFRRGEPIVLALEVMTGDISTVSQASAYAVKRPVGRSTLRGDEPQAFTLTCAYFAPAGNKPGGWTFTKDTAALEPTIYYITAKLVGAFGTELSEPVVVEVTV